MKVSDKKLRKEVMDFTVIVMENLIRELERQGKTTVSVTSLRKFIQNVETNTVVTGKKYVDEFGKHGT